MSKFRALMPDCVFRLQPMSADPSTASCNTCADILWVLSHRPDGKLSVLSTCGSPASFGSSLTTSIMALSAPVYTMKVSHNGIVFNSSSYNCTLIPYVSMCNAGSEAYQQQQQTPHIWAKSLAVYPQQMSPTTGIDKRLDFAKLLF